MLARTAHPIRLPPAMTRWVRGWIWLLVSAVAMQGSVIAMARAAEPAHFHATGPGWQPAGIVDGADAARDPMLDGVRLVRDHHQGLARHQHREVERHHHDAPSTDTVYLDDGASSADTVKKPTAKRLAADLDTPVIGLFAANPPAVPGAHDHPCGCAFQSHIGDLLERPPR